MDPEEETDGWEPNDAPEDSDGAVNPQPSIPEGRRVVRQRRKQKGSSSRETLYLKRRELLEEMQGSDDDEPSAPMGVREQVKRLKEAKKDVAPMEDRWGSSRHRRRGARWILFVVLLVGAPIVAIMVGLTISKERGEPTRAAGRGGMFDEPEGTYTPFDSTSPEAWFHEHSVDAFDDAIALMERCNETEDPADMAEVLRDAPRTVPKMKATGTGWDSPFVLGDPRQLSWEYGGAGDTGFMAISGRRKDHVRFRTYFVKTDEGLKLDWDASRGWSEISVPDLVAEAPKRPTLVRCWVGKQPEFDMSEGRGSLYSWYQILSPEKDEFVWAQVPAGSKLDLELKENLNFGKMVMERKNEGWAIVRLVKPTLGFRETEFELLELVTADWVMP